MLNFMKTLEGTSLLLSTEALFAKIDILVEDTEVILNQSENTLSIADIDKNIVVFSCNISDIQHIHHVKFDKIFTLELLLGQEVVIKYL